MKKTSSKRASADGVKKRKCLVCKDDFESEWSGNRVCKKCRASALWRQGA